MQLKMPVNIHNKFDFEVTDATTGVMKQRVTAYNVVLDNYFTKLLNNTYLSIGSISIGRGSGTLSASRTGLFSEITSRSASSVATAKAYPTSYVKKKVVFNPEEYVGEVITEVGFTGSTHALLTDSEGNPISITKTALDIITIYATLYCTLPMSILNGRGVWNTPANNQFISWIIDDNRTAFTASNSGMSIAFSDILEPADFTAFDRGNTVGSAGSFLGWDNWTRDYANKKISFPTKRVDVNTSNGFLKAVKFGSTFFLKLPHPNTFQGMSLSNIALGTGDGETKDFDIKVPIVKAGTEVIMVNGVVQSEGTDYSIIYNSRYGENATAGVPYLYRRNSGAGYVWHSFDGWNPGGTSNTYPTANEAAFQWDFGSPVIIGGVEALAYSSTWILGCMKMLGSDDGTTWTEIGTVTNITENGSCVNAWTKVWFGNTTAYRYYRWGGSDSLTNLDATSITSGLRLLYGAKAIHFETAPASGVAITADCQTEYILKNTNYVMDIGMTLQLGRS